MRRENVVRGACAITLSLAVLASCASHETASNDAGTPACTPRAAPDPASREYSSDALPAGACDGAVPTCTLAARASCTCPGGAPPFSGGPYNGYTCSCVASEWSCVVTSQGGTICLCTGPDASVDAADGD